jgi:hypothetical protein
MLAILDKIIGVWIQVVMLSLAAIIVLAGISRNFMEFKRGR